MGLSETLEDKYYIKEVDADKISIYCYYDLMGELMIATTSMEKPKCSILKVSPLKLKTYFLSTAILSGIQYLR